MRILAGTTTVLRRIVDLTLIALIVLVLFGLILGKIVPLTGHQTIIIGGGSMQPAIGLGAAVVIGPVRPTDLATGDVVSLNVGAERTTFTHRVVDVVSRADGVWIRTKGDANAEPDPSLVPATSILGRVEWTIPWAGYLLALLSLPVGVIFVLGLAATLLAIAWLLESVETETDQIVVRVAPDASRGEPIAARPDAIGSGFGTPLAAGGPSMATFRNVARPTVPEQLSRSRHIRVQHNRWLADLHDRPRAD
ncbi:MAG TPA: signal peptidase I [Candidatus Limnocylindrales bacterium]|nr:signal peptidase I [Candidatus Limnocylindrales bacterium]